MVVSRRQADLVRAMRLPPVRPYGRTPQVNPGEYAFDGDDLMMEDGRYTPEEVELHTKIASRGKQSVFDNGFADTDEEAEAYLRRHTSPLQGALFFHGRDDDQRGFDARHEAIQQHELIGLPKSVSDGASERSQLGVSDVGRAMNRSRMPTELIRELAGSMSVEDPSTMKIDGRSVGGSYWSSSDHIAIGASRSGNDSVRLHEGTVRHELGHRADFRSVGEDGVPESKSSIAVLPSHAYSTPDPRLEGVADGFEDRYSPGDVPEGASHFQSTGYTTKYQPWERHPQWGAAYAAARAHMQHAGEAPTVSEDHNRVDAYLHKMVNTSPHAVAALDELRLSGWANMAADRYKQTRKVGEQLSLLDEHAAIRPNGSERILGYVPHPSLSHEQFTDDPPGETSFGELRRIRRMNEDVFDIPEDHQPPKPHT